MYASAMGHYECVKLLLGKGARVQAVSSNGSTALLVATRKGYHDVVLLLLQHKAPVDATFNTGGLTSLMVAATQGYLSILQLLLQFHANFTLRNHHGTTLLMLAAQYGHADMTKLLLDRNANLNAEETDGWSALMYAASLGHTAMIQLLLERNAQIGGTDKGGKTAFMVAKDKAVFVKLILEKNATELRFNELMFKGAIECDPKLGKEILNAFVVESGRYSLEFRDLDRIYGRETIQQSALYSILNLEGDDEAEQGVKQHCLQHVVMRRVLQLKWEFFAQRMYIEQFLMYILLLASSVLSGCLYQLDDAAEVTPPPVFKDISNVIWQRNKTSTNGTRSLIAVISFPTASNGTSSTQTTTTNATFDTDTFRFGIMLWSILCVWVVVSYVIAHYGLKPKRLWSLARWSRDGTYSGFFAFLLRGTYIGVNWHEHIPDFPVWQSHAKRLLVAHALFWSVVVSIPICLCILHLDDATIRGYKNWYQAINNLVLWGIAMYFCYWEYKELLGYGLRKYFSLVNATQMSVYLLIIFVYVPCQLGLSHASMLREYQLCLVGFLCLALWILFLQQLEVHPTTGYLLPMMRRLLQDSMRFLILYGVFQAGLTCAYYILLQGSEGYESFPATFVTVFFVLFGQIQTGPIDALSDDQPVLYVFAMGLLMFHMAIAIVLLLNVLIAMMNNTLDEGLEKAKLEALASYANCILRLELSLAPQERNEMIYVIKPKFLHRHQSLLPDDVDAPARRLSFRSANLRMQSLATDEAKPLVVPRPTPQPSSGRHTGILNPSFRQIVLKSDYKVGFEAPVDAHQEWMTEMRGVISTMKKDHATQMQQLKAQLNDITRLIQELEMAQNPRAGLTSSSMQW
ncbi:hypothetical protein SPRG_17493 [Saprolegnia parasitica CBS 223.65]|uniref:Ion transport domain-containing protein n=1 Tax=Saprolegnia parasitica (strain CBS 223.65) TaxID=695850 RepID=A0A067BFD9_SAPPC|nr:hypothetical protein SPRG_17493 [Saprolegnia parasitica CBS 223.65]KDO17094.1 hypothetical protein SPRG_17493 [Saprolegnia parasitica CBS 223.65]|eukprot:XP_012212199.1 hypothetical protein SPRG_17493 [Saprolegnia parasitica CBS 223.65]